MTTTPSGADAASHAVPDHARTVVVPLANPDTAPELLALARAVVRSEAGRVIALLVVLGDADAEANLDRAEAVEQIVETARARDGRVAMDVIVRPAPTIARGILDAIRDEGADLVLLGVQAPTPGDVAVGGVAEQVLRAAECDVLVYRRGRHGRGLEAVDGVVVGVDGSPDSRDAARIGIILGAGLTKPVEILHVRPPSETRREADAIIEAALEGVADAERTTHRTVKAPTATEGLRSHVASSRLTVVGFHTQTDLTGGRLGRTTRGVMDTLRGPVLAISRPRRHAGAAGVVRRAIAFLRPRLTEAEERSLIWHAKLDATLSTDFVVLCVVSAVLATLGLLLDSAAVIIGAMLVAPLMSPIVAVGTAIAHGDVATLRRATATTAAGSAIVALTAIAIGQIVGPDAPTEEMLGRGSPSLLDAGVAAASGVIGAYAGARKGIPAALAGVAIAAALVPPICVFGLALASSARLATGSGLLFVTNIACIAAAASVVLRWLGVHLRSEGSRRYVRYTAPVIAVVLGALVLFGLAGSGPDLGAVERIVAAQVEGVEVVGADAGGPSGTVTVTVRAETAPAPGDLVDATREVAERTGLQLRIAVLEVVTAGS